MTQHHIFFRMLIVGSRQVFWCKVGKKDVKIIGFLASLLFHLIPDEALFHMPHLHL